jgi:nitrogen regulatory protein PII
MKLITAIIRPFKLDEVRRRHRSRRVRHHRRGQGLRPAEGHTELCRGAEYVVDFLPKLKIECAVAADTSTRRARRHRKSASHRQGRRQQGLRHCPRPRHPHPHRQRGADAL